MNQDILISKIDDENPENSAIELKYDFYQKS